MRRYARTATITASLFLALTACSSNENPTPEPATPQPADNAPKTTEPEPAVVGFGDTHTYPDGVTVRADLDRTFVPSDGGFQGDDTPYTLLAVTLTASKQPLQLDTVFEDCTVDGQETQHELFDDITTNWPNLVQAGKTGKWRPSCLVDDGDELQYGLQIGDREPVYWTGPAAQ